MSAATPPASNPDFGTASLATEYLGIPLAHPILPGASPLCDDLDRVRRLEDAGAPALVMHSLFEEQIVNEQLQGYAAFENVKEAYGEALSYLPEPEAFTLGPETYLEQIRRIREATDLACIASLNGTTPGGWTDYARLIEQAGATALELNLYELASEAAESSEAIETRLADIVTAVRGAIGIPLAVKLAPYATGLPHFARRLHEAGADALVLFNRVYQPALDLETLQMQPVSPVHLGQKGLRLRGLGLLWDPAGPELAATGGFMTGLDVAEGLAAGANVVQCVSALLIHGPEHLGVLRGQLHAWMEEHEYATVDQLRGCMSRARCPDPSSYTRANYMRTLLSWRL